MGHDQQDVDVSRRHLGALLGVLGGAAGLAALTACAGDAEANGEPERTGAIAQALSGSNFIWVDSIAGTGANLRSSSLAGSDDAGTSKAVAIVGGYYAPGDGGGGVFYWSNASGTDDGGTFIVPNGSAEAGSTGTGWKRIYNGSLNVKWFGAKGDGTTRDDPAIQLAINAAAAEDFTGTPTRSGAGVVYFPSGSYVVDTPLTVYCTGVAGTTQSNIVLRGANAGASGEYQRSALVWNGSSTTLPILQMWSRDNVVEFLDFYVNPAKTCLCAIDDTQYPGGHQNTNNTYRHVRISNDGNTGTFTYGIKLADTAAGSDGGVGAYPNNVDYHRFEACYFDLRRGTACVYCPNNQGQSRHHLFSHCTFLNAQYALLFQSGHFRALSCGVAAITTTAIRIEFTNGPVVIDDSDVEDCPQFFFGGGQAAPWPVIIMGGRYDVSTGKGSYAKYMYESAGGALMLLGVYFGPPGNTGLDTFTVGCEIGTVPGNLTGGILVAIGCSFPNTTASTPFASGGSTLPQRVIAFGNHRFNTVSGDYIAQMDDQLFNFNSGEQLVVNGIAAFWGQTSAPTGTPPTFTLFVDPADGKLKSLGPKGTVTVIAAP